MRVLCWTILLSMSFLTLASAHPPMDIAIEVSGTQVNVTVDHPVGDPNTHYIDKIEVFSNGNKVAEQSFTKQDGNYQKTTFTINSLKKGDVLQVAANCNRFGNLKKNAVAGS